MIALPFSHLCLPQGLQGFVNVGLVWEALGPLVYLVHQDFQV